MQFMKSPSFLCFKAVLGFSYGLLLFAIRSGWGADQYTSPAYREPSAFAGTEQVVVVGELVSFFGAGTSSDDEIVQYEWDFESDGVQDFISTQTGYTTHRFNLPGDYDCLLTVKDSLGCTARHTRRIIVVTEKVDTKTAEQMLHPKNIPIYNPADGVTHRYAIMINGGSERRFWIDVDLTYGMLRREYGFSPSDIYLLNYDGMDPDGGNPNGMIDYSADYADLQTVFNELGARIDEDDELFIWMTDHGRGYAGPLSEGGQYLGYCDGRISVDPGDEPDFLESNFKLRSLFTGGDYRCNHGLDVWRVRKQFYSVSKTEFYRNKYVSTLDNVYIENIGTTVSDYDVYIERLIDYCLGDTNRDGYIDTSAGEVFDFDHDGKPPYRHDTGEYDEDDWGTIDKWDDNYNHVNGGLPVGGYPYQIFDEGLQGKICIDLGYTGGPLQVDARDEDNAGLFDWMDVNQDGDTLDIVSVDEIVCLYIGDLHDDDLADLLNTITTAKVTIVALSCFSGGLVEDISSPTRIICTATIEEAVSWGNVFIRGFVAALHGRDEYGNPVNADTSQNGYVSMLEAFNYAAGNDNYDEIPQYDDNGDGASHTDPVPKGEDGVLGCQTYLVELIAGDFDGNSDVDFLDYAILAAHWLETDCEGCSGVDLTCDAKVDLFDLHQFTNNWLTGN